MDSSSTAMEFATIDELLDGDEEDEEEEEKDPVPEPLPAVKEEDACDNKEHVDDSKHATANAELGSEDIREESQLEDTLVDEIEAEEEEAEEVKEAISYPPLDAAKLNIFSSSLLDDVISQRELQGAAQIPPNSALEG